MAKVSSIEEKIEDYFKKQLDAYGVKYFTKTEPINSDIDEALKNAPSKSGGNGKNYPDIRVLLETKTMRRIPVMVEVKGKMGDLVKFDKDGAIELITEYKADTKKHKKGDLNYEAIEKYAVNGAVHYAQAILGYGNTYKECIAIGINGYEIETGSLKTEIAVYYVSKNNMMLPKQVSEYSDLSILKKENLDALIKKIDTLELTEEEIEKKTKEIELQLDNKLKYINQVMQDTLQINVNYRVNLVSGMIMAGLGIEDEVAPLELDELRGSLGKKDHDGYKLLNKIESFLDKKKLPDDKREMLIATLSPVFIYDTLWRPVNGESKLKSIYSLIYKEILPIFRTSYHLDFTGKLFNVLNDWVSVPDGDKNDVVFTPRYVTDLMAKLAKVNMDSYVWDYAAGSAGFLVSSMKIMLNDARRRITSPDKLSEKEKHIKFEQLLGIEKLSDIYMLAVLNMILMGDGSSNIIHKDSLREYTGKYEQGEKKDEDFPANVFLLNPPYSADGKGFVFVEKALSKMKSGRAVILVQETAGSGKGLPYTKDLLKNNTLVASIHMADIFWGKAGVQTAIYVFDVGTAHDEKQIVKFLDFSNDGYSRQNRKRARQEVNLRNTDHAQERYEEVLNLVLYGKQYLNFYSENEYIEDVITLNGDDWTFALHKKANIIPNENDFREIIGDYLCWEITSHLKGHLRQSGYISKLFNDCPVSNPVDLYDAKFEEFPVGMLFNIHPTKGRVLSGKAGNTPVLSNTATNNGINKYVGDSATEEGGIVTFSDTTESEKTVFYQPNPFIGFSHVQGMYPYSDRWGKYSLLFFIVAFKKSIGTVYDYATKFNRDIANALMVSLPIDKSGEIDFAFMEKYIIWVEKKILCDTIL